MSSTALYLALALEFPPTLIAESFSFEHCYLSRESAQPLSMQLAFELGKHLPSLDGLHLSWMAGVYDQSQLLRPNFPVFAALHKLTQAGSNQLAPGAQVITFQALRGEPPLPELAVQQDLLGGALCLIPICLSGSAERIAAARETLEQSLLERGLTDARTALMLHRALQSFCPEACEHARLMTLDDLAALCAVQLQNQQLDAVWQIIESALYGVPVGTQSRESGTGNQFDTLDLVAGRVQIRVPTLPAVQIPEISQTRLSLAPELIAELGLIRQACMLFKAHALPMDVRFAATPYSSLSQQDDYLAIVWSGSALTDIEQIYAVRDEQLGIAWYTLWHQQQLVATALPLKPGAHAALGRRFPDAKRS